MSEIQVFQFFGVVALTVLAFVGLYFAFRPAPPRPRPRLVEPVVPESRDAVEAKPPAPTDARALEIGQLPEARVEYVHDGDTLFVAKGWWGQTKIRLACIDCPEDGQPWGDTAKFGLLKIVGGRKVRLEEHGQDVHGRTVATLYVWDSETAAWQNVNERMVMLGHAWVLRKFSKHLPKGRQVTLDRLEAWARSKKVGLWRTESPIPPWRWRQGTSSPP